MDKGIQSREALMAEIDGIFTKVIKAGEMLLHLSNEELTEQIARSYFQQATVQMARLKMQSRSLHLDLDTERRQREVRRTHVDQLQLTHENLLYQKAHIQREIEKCKDLPTPNIDEVQREMGTSLGTTIYVENLEEINSQTIKALMGEKEARIAMKQQLETLEETHAKGAEELQRKRKYLDDIPDQVAKIRGTSKDLAEDLTSIVKEIHEKNKRRRKESITSVAAVEEAPATVDTKMAVDDDVAVDEEVTST